MVDRLVRHGVRRARPVVPYQGIQLWRREELDGEADAAWVELLAGGGRRDVLGCDINRETVREVKLVGEPG